MSCPQLQHIGAEGTCHDRPRRQPSRILGQGAILARRSVTGGAGSASVRMNWPPGWASAANGLSTLIKEKLRAAMSLVLRTLGARLAPLGW
jgi:hypothetical protein